MADIFIIGCGYVGSLIAQQWRNEGTSVTALARSEAAAAKLQALGINSRHGDLDDPASLRGLPLAGAILYYLAPPPPVGTTDNRMRHFVAALDPATLPRTIVYISTTGVYGDTAGEWVSEASPLNPQADRARRRVDAETTLGAWCEGHGVPLTILRVAGIYGPDKLPVKRLREGTPVLREEECGYTNRIHVEDLVTICLKVVRSGEGMRVYNVSDGHPGTMSGYFNAVADALGLPRPPAITMAEAHRVLTPAMLSYLTESRRMDNRKLLDELGVVLKYPNLAAGLAALQR